MENTPLVSIRCPVYNHESYIRQCLDGFVMQKTSFTFEVIVHDDASTDGSVNIIKEYAEKYPNIIKPIYESENQYSKKDGTLRKIIDAAINPSSKYIAMCEGDDYWIDPLKLQKQVDFLESHPDYIMCCSRTKLFSEKTKKIIGENYCYNRSQDIHIKDIINRTGLFISTCSMLYRRFVRLDYPSYCTKCAVGDYPLQIMCAMKGKAYYFNENMAVYRVANPKSWMGQQDWSSVSESNIKRINSMITMFNGFLKDYPHYRVILKNKIAEYINTGCPSIFVDSKSNRDYFKAFMDETKKYSLKWKIDLFFRTHSNLFSRIYLSRIAPHFLKNYHSKRLIYK